MSEHVSAARVAAVYVAVSSLHPNPWNPNQQSEVVRRAERESIEAYGFVDPITVREHPTIVDAYEIIDGEHRWQAAQELGYTEVPVVVLVLDDTAARKLTVILNETRGDADAVLLGQLLSELKDMSDPDVFALGLPYTGSELDHLLAIGGGDWDQYRVSPLADPVFDPLPTLRELTLTMDTDTFDQFNRWVEMLGKEWELPDAGVTALVVEAVKRQALSANQGRKKT